MEFNHTNAKGLASVLFMTYKDTILKLFELQKFGMKFGLDSMRAILTRLGNPERGGKFIHLAGTNGKGSTLAFLSSVLREAGFKTGLYTSPHLVTFRERIQVDGALLSEADVIALAEEVWEATDPSRPPTFFEFVTAMAFVHFKRVGTDIVLMETGLGGRLDSTNVLDPLISAVTNIGLEHTEHLGTTIEEIAFEKAGVIKEGRPFAAGRLLPAAERIMQGRAAELKTSVKLFDRDYQVGAEVDDLGLPVISYRGMDWDLRKLDLGLIGGYQADNAGLALAILEELPSLGYAVSEDAVRSGLRNARWPGRGELFPPGTWPADGSGKAPLILDGAHNPDGAKAFSGFLSRRPEKKLHLVVGVMADKDVAGVLAPIIGLADHLYLTRPEYARAADPGVLLERILVSLGEPGNLRGLHPDDHPSRRADIEELVISASRATSLDSYLADMTLDPPGTRQVAKDGKTEKTLTLSTIHSAKGLEWDHVFILSLTDGRFPLYYATKTERETEEERRLLYVALTRAKDGLNLMFPVVETYDFTLDRPSRFLEDLPEGVLDLRRGGRPAKRASIFKKSFRADGDWDDFEEFSQSLALPQKKTKISFRSRPRPTTAEGPGTTPSGLSARKRIAIPEKGQLVEHITFGRGKVVNVKGDKVTVDFDGFGNKSLNYILPCLYRVD